MGLMHSNATAKMDSMAFSAKTTLMNVSQTLVQTTVPVMMVSTSLHVLARQVLPEYLAVWTLITVTLCRASMMLPALKPQTLSHASAQMDSMATSVNTILTIAKMYYVLMVGRA